MSRLEEELAARVKMDLRTPAQQAVIQAYEQRITKFKKLFANKEFEEYLKLEAEMNDPKIVIAHKCSDPACEALKQKIRDFWNRQRVLDKLRPTNGTQRTRSQPD